MPVETCRQSNATLHVVAGRRRLVLGLACLPAGLAAPARAHHGWSSFDQDRPLFLAGRARNIRWQNPHAQLQLDVAAGLALPADARKRNLPAEQQPVDTAALLSKVAVPEGAAGAWDVELAPLSRMQAWQVQPLTEGGTVELIGYALRDGARVLRAEYLFVAGNVYGLRSSPAR